jgi:predicted nucleic acid-binding protein
VFPDTSVLYPVSLLDLLMRLAENWIHDIVWSEDLLAELNEKWREGRADGKRVPSEGAAAAALEGIRRTFADTRVDRNAYEHLIDDMPGNDEDDKPHIAAAKAGTATHIVTSDRSGGFPQEEIAELGIHVQRLDDYLHGLMVEFSDDCRRIVYEMVERRRHHDPDLTVEDLAERWRSHLGLARFCGALDLRPHERRRPAR